MAEAEPRTLDPACVYIPSPTVAEFINAVREGPVNEMRVLVLRSSRGEGKTSGALWACVALGERLMQESPQVLPLRVGVVRDTWTNLERTSIPTFQENARIGLNLAFLKGGHEAEIATAAGPLVHFWFFGLDTKEDVDNLSGFTCGVFWLEEVAPAAGVASGIPASAFGIGGTSARQTGVPPRIVVTMNPPDKNHWILRVEHLLAEQNLKGVRVEHFLIPSGERSAHFRTLAAMGEGEAWRRAADAFDAYRSRNRPLLEAIGRHDLVARLVEGEIGEVRLGTAVVPNFSRLLHVAKGPLQIVRGLTIHRLFDAGVNDLHPACVWGQVGPDWINVLGSRVGTNVSFEDFLRNEVLPFERKYRLVKARSAAGGFGPGARQGFPFRTIGDPAMFATDGRSNRTAALVFELMFKEGVEPGPVEWSARRESLHAAFGRKGPGDRLFVQIDPDENEILIDGLAGRFHYPENKTTGEPIADLTAAKKASGVYSHPVDALGYGVATLFPAHEWVMAQMRERPPGGPQKDSTWLGR